MAAIAGNKGSQSAQSETFEPLEPPGTWSDPARHLEVALYDPWYRLLSGLQACFVDTTVDVFRGRDFKPALMPTTVGSISSPMGLGSDSLPVDIELFGERTHLADSMQFQLEFLLRHGYDGVYYVMPTFRGEDSDATHLNQFFHSEAELCGGLDDVMALVDGYLESLARAVLDDPIIESVEEIAGNVDHLETAASGRRLDRVPFSQALEELGAGAPCFDQLEDGTPIITRVGETRLIEKHHGGAWLTHPPVNSVPFYQAEREDGGSLSADLLLGPGEVVGCGERHDSGERVRKSLENHRVDPAPYHWYIEMKERCPLRTSGFGMGMERFLMWVLRHDDIRDMQIFPRLKGNETWI